MRVIVLAVMVWIFPIICMDIPQFKFEQEGEHVARHKDDESFIESSNTPLTAAVAINHCFFCMEDAVHQARSQEGYWEFLERLWRGAWKPSEDLSYALWNAVSYKAKNLQLEVLFNGFSFYSEIEIYYCSLRGFSTHPELAKIKRNG